MASIKSAPRSALTTFAPDAPYMAAGTVAGAVDLSFSSSAHLEIFKLDFQSDGADLPLAGACPSNERFHRLSWSKPGSGSAENYSLGLIAGGHGDGTIGVWNPLRLISSDQEGVVVASLERHTGSVRGLEFNSLAPNLLASGADGGEICIWDLENPAEPVMFPPLKGMAETSILSPEGPSASDDEIRDLEVSTVQNNKKRLRKDSDAGKKRGVCYLSRVPPHMDPTRLRQILSQYGDIHRIYLVPENPTVQVQRKQVGGFRGKQFSEGWVEFTRRSVAKKVANILNGEQIGGKRRSSFYYDIWNIKYLNKFKWDDLTTETANNNRTREQKLTMEISAAKRERDFYLKKVDQSKALKFMKERMNKKQKVSEHVEDVEEAKVIRRFPQNRPVADRAVQSKPGLSKDTLKEVFGSSSS